MSFTHNWFGRVGKIVRSDPLQKSDTLQQWFGLPKQEMTPEAVRELKAIQLRGYEFHEITLATSEG